MLLLLQMGKLGRILLIQDLCDLLQTFEGALAIRSFNFIEVGAKSLHLGINSDRQLARALQLHDVDLGPQVFGKMAVNSEPNEAVPALEGPRVGRGRCPECLVDVNLVEVARRPLVLQKVALGAEGHRAVLAAEGSLHVVDVDVEPQLRRLREDLFADSALRLPVGPRLDDVLVAVQCDAITFALIFLSQQFLSYLLIRLSRK